MYHGVSKAITMPGSSTASESAEMNGHSSLQIEAPTPWPKWPRP